MIEIKGQYNSAIVYQSEIDDATRDQLQTLINQPFVENEKIRVMPDCHAGAGCVIGFTQTINNGKVCPNLVGVDASCGMYLIKLEGIEEKDFNGKELDRFIETHIPTGRNIHDVKVVSFPEITHLRCFRELRDTQKFEKALGSLGGG